MPGVKKSTSKSKGSSTKSASAKKGYYDEPDQMPARLEDNSGRIFAAVFVLLFGIMALVSIFYNEGKFISGFANILKGIFGWGYWLIGGCLIFIGIILIFSKSKPIAFRVICLSLLPIFFSSFINIVGDFTLTNYVKTLYEDGKIFKCGGVIPGAFAWMLNTYLGKVISIIILGILNVVMLFCGLGADASAFRRADKTEFGEEDGDSLFNLRPSLTNIIEEEKEPITSKTFKSPLSSLIRHDNAAQISKPVISNAGRNQASAYNMPLGEDEFESKPKKTTSSNRVNTRRTADVPLTPTNKIPITIEKNNSPIAANITTASTVEDMKEPEKVTKEDIRKETAKVAKTISEKSAEPVSYTYPDVELLEPSKYNGADSQDQLYATQDRLESTLHSFGIMSNVVKITPGPTVTRYDIELEQGVKLSKVTNLAGDLALSLGVMNVRVAPIPDEISTVGIEVPNKIVNTVSLRDIIESKNFQTAKSKLTFAIGEDIGGNAIVGDISKLPHMLIAGTTGSGKSVCMNSLILSLLYKSRPDEVKFIMIDPKMVELGIYNSIPHLYVPVVTEPKKAAGALQWAVVEMLKRYRLFSEAGVRDLATYNQYCEHAGEQTLPQVVILIDELADLMMAASKEVEESICRVAQMGRAAGMHLIIATQRPSADVITGLMKANIPSRIAFAVSSAMESRIIMDQSGAEKLIGHGDMLYSPIGIGKPIRIQGCFVSDEEREKIVNFIKDNSDFKAEVPEELKEAIEKGVDSPNSQDSSSSSNSNKNNNLAGDYDEMLPQAVEVVLEMKSCSVSMLQRRLKLGYSRAARVVDQMEELGIVGPYEGAKPRSLIIDRNGWNEIQVKLGLASEDDFALAHEMSESSDAELESVSDVMYTVDEVTDEE